MGPFTKLPQKQSLEKQTADVLREQIAAGAWKEWLPGERLLGEMLQVSRYTVRGALGQLQQQHQIVAEPGRGNRIVQRRMRPSAAAARPPSVGLLITGEVELITPRQVMWVDHLRAMLAARGCNLHLFHGHKFAQGNPDQALKELMGRHVHQCWILLLSSRQVQEWFQRHAVPCVVAGSVNDGISLPSCDVDYRAVCRHAAGMLVVRRHRQFAFLREKTNRPGSMEGEAGFREGVKASDAQVMVSYHDGTAAGVSGALKMLMNRRPRPTALIVINSFHFLTVLTALPRLGYRVPEDVSVIACEAETFMSHLIPTPAHYAVDPKTFAKALFAQISDLLQDGTTRKRAVKIVPVFRAGQSIANLA